MAQPHPAGQPQAGKKQYPATAQYPVAKILDLAHPIYHLPASCRVDIEAYVQMRVLLDRLVAASRNVGK